jgi:hypothetical protein
VATSNEKISCCQNCIGCRQAQFLTYFNHSCDSLEQTTLVTHLLVQLGSAWSLTETMV